MRMIVRRDWTRSPSSKTRWNKFRAAPWRTLSNAAHRRIYDHLSTRMQPGLIVVSCAACLSREIFGIPRIGTVNVHLGIAPQYRGTNNIFWPLYNRDYEHIGLTLHFVNEGLDGGPMIAQAPPDAPKRHQDNASRKICIPDCFWDSCRRLGGQLR